MVEMRKNGVLEQINAQYYELTNSERRIADFVLQNVDKVQFMSITELANASKVADATVTRFCRRLNLPGFASFKLEVAKSFTATDGQRGEAANGSAQSRGRSTGLWVQQAIEETVQKTDEAAISAAVSHIEKAEKVLCLGSGGGYISAMQMTHIFSDICDKFKTFGDSHMQYREIASMSPEDLLIVLSYSGATKSGVKLLEQAKERGIHTILITHFSRSPAAKHADIVLQSGYNERPLEAGSIPAWVATMTVVDMLSHEYYCRNRIQCEAYRGKVAEMIASQHT